MAKSRRRTGRQRAASKRNIRKAQIVSARKRKGISRKGVLKGIAIGAVVAGTAVTARKVYNDQFVTLYHNTHDANATKIAREGFKEGLGHPLDGGRAFFHIGKNTGWYGPETMQIRMRKSHLKKELGTQRRIKYDFNEIDSTGMPAVSIHPNHIKSMKLKVVRGRRVKNGPWG